MKRKKTIARITVIILIAFLQLLAWNKCYSSTARPEITISDTVISNILIRVDSFGLELIPPSSGVSFYKDGIIYMASTRFESKIPDKFLSFGTTYAKYSTLDNGKLTRHNRFTTSSPFGYPCEAISFNKDYSKMYYTGYRKEDQKLKIFTAEILDNQGEVNLNFDALPLEFCNTNSNYMHPAISTNGEMIVFASDCPGSIGGMDLFVSIKNDSGWSQPVNLGNAINSAANEIYPFLDTNCNLYFSSNTDQGFGGYDIYVCKFRKNTWDKPLNISKPLNTQFDDLAFSLDRSNCNTAFYTVKQNRGRKSQQLFHVSLDPATHDTLLTLSQYFTNRDISSVLVLPIEPAVEATGERAETARLRRLETTENNNIIYRVHFMTSFNPGTRATVNIQGINYPVYEYLYAGAYRLFIGEFSSTAKAFELQQKMTDNDFPGAVVSAFKNNILSPDPVSPDITITDIDLKSEEQAQTDIEIPLKEQKVLPDTMLTDKDQASRDSIITADTETRNIPETVKVQPQTDRNIVYRIQVLSTTKPAGNYTISISGREYSTWEYFYLGAYRTTIGKFSKLDDALSFQTFLRSNGYPQAFVAAFINDKRSTDRSLFKR